MIHKLLIIIGASAITCGLLEAQDLQDLKFYADIMVNANDDAHKARAGELFNQQVETLATQGAATMKVLDDIEYISVQKPANQSFTLYTWQVKHSETSYSQYGYLVTSSGSVIKLSAATIDPVDAVYMETNADEWFGALYYAIKETTYDGKPAYLLFGYNGYGQYERMKVVDVLRFKDDETPVFGAELFVMNPDAPRPDVRSRHILTYSKDSNVTLNYNAGLEMIVYDHLINRMGQIPGQGSTWLADGSYEGFKWRDNRWVHVDKLYNEILSDGNYPRPYPVLDQRKEGRASQGK